jgi:hypothetical protein
LSGSPNAVRQLNVTNANGVLASNLPPREVPICPISTDPLLAESRHVLSLLPFFLAWADRSIFLLRDLLRVLIQFGIPTERGNAVT